MGVSGTDCRAGWIGVRPARVRQVPQSDLVGTAPQMTTTEMQFMNVERFKDGRADEVYRRLREKGRMMPDGLDYVDSWVEPSLERCFQVVECEDRSLIRQRIAQWDDLIEFGVVPFPKTQSVVSTMPEKTPKTVRFDEAEGSTDVASRPSDRGVRSPATRGKNILPLHRIDGRSAPPIPTYASIYADCFDDGHVLSRGISKR